MCTGAKDSSSPCFGLIQGTEGYIRVEGPVSAGSSVQLCTGEGTVCLAEDDSGGSLTAELREFARQQQEGDLSSCYRMLDHSVMMMEVVDAAREQR